MSAHAEGFPPAHAGAGSAASGQLEELQGFSRHLLTKLDESRNIGQFSQAEIELLRKKLSVVVNAFSAERAKIEGELNTMAHAYEQDIAERDYAISSAQLELANAKRHIKVLEVQRSALSDDVETARTEYEVLVAQLAEEQDSGDALKRELSSLRRALQQAAHGLSEADAELERTTRQLEEARRDVARAERDAERDAERGASLRAQTTDAQAAATQLARAEAKLEEVMRREAGLEQRLIFEREAKEALEETAARERAAAARAAEDASRVAGEAASLRREVTEQRGAQHELQRLLAERDGSLAVLKAQLADAEGKYASTRAGTEPELRGRLHEVERRAAEMARELGAKGAALQALERQLGERTAEAATERERAERSRHRVRALEAELRAERSRDSSSAGPGASGGGGSGAFASRGDAGRGEKRTSAPPPPRFPAAERKGRQKQKRVAEAEEKAVEEKVVEARSEKERAAAKEAAKEKAQAAVAAAAELETSGADGSLGSLFAGDGANAVVVNVLDHLSLSGYVSPLAKEKAAAGAAEPAGVTVGGLNLTPPGTAEKPSAAKARAKRVAAAFESEETASETATEKPEAPVSEPTEAQNRKEGEGFVASEAAPADVAVDVSKPPDPAFVDDDASTEELEAPDAGEEVAPRVTRSAKKATPAKEAKGETPGQRERGKTPKGKLIGGLRMPLANLGQKKSSDSGSGGAAARGAAEAGKEKGGERKKRRLLNQQTVGGGDETHPSLLFGVGSDFAVPKPP